MRLRTVVLSVLMLAALSHRISRPNPKRQSSEKPKRAEFHREIYYRNKLEFSLETGWLPNNIPFAFDFLLGGGYNVTGLQYTLVPTLASLRWHMGDVRGPSILRGNWDLT